MISKPGLQLTKNSRVFATFTLSAALAAAIVLTPTGAFAKVYNALPGESTLTYGMVHPMHKFSGVSRDFKCEVDLSADTVSSKIRVVAPIKTFDTGNASRDSHAMEMTNALKWPNVTFASTLVKPEGAGYRVAGDLTFHGQTRPVDFLVTPKNVDGKVEITGGFTVTLTEFGVERPSLLFVPVEDKLTISFDLFSKL